MASDKKFVVKNGLTTQNISFVDSTTSPANTITVSLTGNDTLSFSGDSGQLFSITDSMTGTIFAVNDISGVPSIEVDDDGTIRFAETFGNVLIGTATDNGTDKLQVSGDILATNFKGALIGNADTATKWATARTISLTGAVTGSVSIDGSGNVSLATTATSDPTLTLNGDVSGSATFTNLGNATLTATVADDSHNHSSSSGNFTVGGDLTVSGGDIVLSGTGRIQGIDTVSSSTDAANKSYVDTAIANLVDTAPTTLDTLNELAAALGDDPNFATTVTNSIGTKVSKSGDTMTGTLNINTAAGVFGIGFSETNEGMVYTPVEASGLAQRYFLKFDYTNNASYPYLTNRTPSGAVVIKTGTAAGGAEIERIRFNGGDGTQDIVISNAVLKSGTNVYWHAGNDGASSGLDADLLDGQHGSYYYSPGNPPPYDNYVSWTAQDGDTTTYTITSGDTLQFAEGTGMDVNFTADDVLTFTNTKPFDYFVLEDGDGTEVQISNLKEVKFVEGSGTGATIDIDWTDVDPGSDADPYDLTFTVTNTDRGSSQAIFKNFNVSDTNSGYTWSEIGTVVADNNNDTVTFVSGGAIDIDVDTTNDAILINHADTSSQGSVNNSNGVVIQDVTLDTYGHVTGLASVDLDDRYAFRKAWTSVIPLNTYYRVARVTGNNLSSATRFSFTGTANGVVIAVIADIICNHSGDIYIHTQSGDYTGIDIRCISDTNENFDVYIRYTTGTGATVTLYTEAFPLNSEAIDANPTATAYTGTTLDHNTGIGDTRYSQSSGNVNVYTDGDFYANNQKVFNDAYHPNADTWTTARTNTVTLTGDVTGSGSASVNGSGNWTVTVNTTVGNDSHTHTFDSLTAKTGGTGTYQTSGDFRAPLFYDSNNTGYYVDPAGTSNIVTLNATRINDVRIAPGDIRNNLGSPTVEEQALFHGQFNNKFRFIAPTLQEESTDGVNWTTSTRATADQLLDMMIGEGQSTSFTAIPSGTVGTYGGYRLTWDVTSVVGYIFLNYLYVYNSTNGNTINLLIEAYHNTNGWTTIVGPSSFNNWPGHTTFKHGNLPYSTNASQYGKVRITFSSTHNANTNGFTLYGIEWFGGYPAGRRNVEYYDRLKNVFFPNDLNAGTALRSPIFYDSNNTSYFVNPAGISTVYGLHINGGAAGTDSQNQLFLWGFDTTTSAIGFKSNGGEFPNPTGFGDGYNTYLTMDTDGRGWVFRRGTGGSNFASAYNAGWILNNGVAQFNNSTRSPIFYDSNDTGYYVDPSSTSRLNYTVTRRLKFIGESGDSGLSTDEPYAIYQEGGSWTSPFPDLRIAFHTGIKLGANATYNGIRFYNDYNMATQVMSVNNASDPLGANNVYVNNSLQAGSSLRAPIFYDSNDTGYYVDPASTSVLNRISTVRTNDWLYIDQNYGHSVTGVYSATRLQGVWSMGNSYKLAADGTTSGNLYGIAWSHPNAGTIGGANNLASHGMLILENGGFKGAWGGGSLRTPADVRAPIFYDYDNTAYYGDFASAGTSVYINGSYGTSATNGNGLRFWGASTSYAIWMSAASNTTYGGRIAGETTSDYNMYFRMNGGTNRGFVFETAYATKIFSINPNAVRSNVDVIIDGALNATTKSFLIDHPTKPGKKLRHGSLEGPENGVYVRGKISGKVIELPEYWTKLVDPDSITVQLTSIGKDQRLYVEDIRDNKVYIASEIIDTPNCFYIVHAERVDVEKLEVEID